MNIFSGKKKNNHRIPLGPLDFPKNREAFASLPELCTELWRLHRMVIDPQTGKPKEGLKRIGRSLMAAIDILTKDCILIQDHTGMPFDSGMSLIVRSYQDFPGLIRMEVIETLKPSIYQNQKLLQIGEVIVGKPLENTPTKKGAKESESNDH